MAKETEQTNTKPATEAAEQQARPCPQDCRLCGTSQQLFCTTKMLFDLSKAQQRLAQKMEAMEKSVADIQSHLQPKEADGELVLPFAK